MVLRAVLECEAIAISESGTARAKQLIRLPYRRDVVLRNPVESLPVGIPRYMAKPLQY